MIGSMTAAAATNGTKYDRMRWNFLGLVTRSTHNASNSMGNQPKPKVQEVTSTVFNLCKSSRVTIDFPVITCN